MPTISAAASSAPSSVAVTASSLSVSRPNLWVIVGISVGVLVLLCVALALSIPLLKSRRAAKRRAPSDEFKGMLMRNEKADYEYYPTHRQQDSGGSSVGGDEGTPLVGRHVPFVIPAHQPPLPMPFPDSYNDEAAFQAVQQPMLMPAASVQASTPTHDLPQSLRIAIPQSPGWLQRQPSQQPTAAAAPPSPSSSSSEYSQRSAAAMTARNILRMQTIDLASPPPPVPAVPASLRRLKESEQPETRPLVVRKPSEPRPLPEDEPLPSPQILENTLHLGLRSELPPESPPLVRGDTLNVANLLKARARRVVDSDDASNATIQRSGTRTSFIERVGSIRDAPEVLELPSARANRASRWRELRLKQQLVRQDSDDGFGESLDFYREEPVSPSSMDTIVPRRTLAD